MSRNDAGWETSSAVRARRFSSVGATGFEPATFRPPAQGIRFRSTPLLPAQARIRPLSSAQFLSNWTPNWTPSPASPEKAALTIATFLHRAEPSQVRLRAPSRESFRRTDSHASRTVVLTVGNNQVTPDIPGYPGLGPGHRAGHAERGEPAARPGSSDALTNGPRRRLRRRGLLCLRRRRQQSARESRRSRMRRSLPAPPQ